jgi:hypothetical protein
MDAQFLTAILESARDAGLLPIVWVVGAVILVNRMPWLKSILFSKSPARSSADVTDDTKGLVLRKECHLAMDKIDKEFILLHDKANKTNEKIDTLSGYIRGKFENQ